MCPSLLPVPCQTKYLDVVAVALVYLVIMWGLYKAAGVRIGRDCLTTGRMFIVRLQVRLPGILARAQRLLGIVRSCFIRSSKPPIDVSSPFCYRLALAEPHENHHGRTSKALLPGY